MRSQFETFKKICKTKETELESFNLLTDIIQNQVNNLGISKLNSTVAIEKIKKVTPKWSDAKFSYLLIHSCYIPDYYPETGSEETLFSKLVEYLIYEWGERLGYHAKLQTQKSTKEDVVFFKKDDVIVCDAKSSRLGRSQKSPNVKDVIKTSEYKTWIEFYTEKNKIGGFATFPSLMEWSKGSTVHTYLTDKENPIMLIYNEYLAFMLLKKNKNSNLLFDTLSNYSFFFPKKILNKEDAKAKYEEMILSQLKTLQDGNEFEQFLNLAKRIIDKYVKFSIKKLEDIIRKNTRDSKKEADQVPVKTLRERYSKLKSNSLNKDYERVLQNIIKFRT